jgi:hypothetical protein
MNRACLDVSKIIGARSQKVVKVVVAWGTLLGPGLARYWGQVLKNHFLQFFKTLLTVV